MSEFSASVLAFVQSLGPAIALLPSQYAAAVLAEVQRRTPVRSGRLRDGWQMKDNGNGTSTVWNAVPYAVLIEDGDQRYSPHKMLALTIADIVNRNPK